MEVGLIGIRKVQMRYNFLLLFLLLLIPSHSDAVRVLSDYEYCMSFSHEKYGCQKQDINNEEFFSGLRKNSALGLVCEMKSPFQSSAENELNLIFVDKHFFISYIAEYQALISQIPAVWERETITIDVEDKRLELNRASLVLTEMSDFFAKYEYACRQADIEKMRQKLNKTINEAKSKNKI